MSHDSILSFNTGLGNNILFFVLSCHQIASNKSAITNNKLTISIITGPINIRISHNIQMRWRTIIQPFTWSPFKILQDTTNNNLIMLIQTLRLNIPTINVILSRVTVKWISLSINHLYFLELASDSPRFWLKWILGFIGVSMGLDPNVPVSSNISVRYFLWDKNTFWRASNLAPKKIPQETKVFHMTMRTQINFQLNNTLMIISSDNNIININCKNNSVNRIMSYKYTVIRGAPSQSIVCSNRTEFVKPCSCRLFQTIYCFFEFTDRVCLPLNLITRGLKHIHLLLKIFMPECIFNI